MREEVVAWCADMTDDLDLPPAVVAVAINIFDRFLIRQKVTKSVLYPLTASCLLLACKLIMDDDIPRDDIAARSRLPLDDIYVMEAVVLSVLNWRVHVITPHEVAYELCTLYPQHVQRRQPLLEGLLLNALLDYRLAWLRATSIGVACFILSSCAMDPHPMDAKHHPVYKLAAQCGVSLSELDYCIVCLQDSINALLVEQLDDVVTDQEDA